MPTSKLPGKFMTVSISDMGVQNGSPTAPGTATVLTAVLKSIEVNRNASETDMTAVTDDLTYTQVTHESDEATVELFVPDTGAQLAGLFGHYVSLKWREKATLAEKTLVGVVTSHKWAGQDAQAETITIKGGAN